MEISPPQQSNFKIVVDKEEYINCLLPLLEEPAIMDNSSLSKLLKKELNQLMNQESVELSKASLERYKWTKKLLINQKVNLFVVKKLQKLPSFDLPAIAFGKAKWERYFGDVGVEPPLPIDIDGILNAQCSFWPDKKVEDTHLLVLIPQTVNGVPFDLDSLSELIKQPKTGPKTQYSYYDDDVKNELGIKSSPSRWVLITKDVIPGSRGETYGNQESLVASHAQRSGSRYALPLALDAAAAVLMHYVETGERLYSDNPVTYTRCQKEVTREWPAAIGGFSSEGLYITLHDLELRDNLFTRYIDGSGVGAACQFFS